MKHTPITHLAFLALASLSVACGGGGGSSGGSAAIAPGSTAGGSTSGGGTTGGTTGGTSNGVVASDLATPTALASGTITLSYKLSDAAANPTDIKVEFTLGGGIWRDCSKGQGGDGRTGLTTAAAPGAPHTFVWNSALDLPNQFVNTVITRVTPLGGRFAEGSPFAIDNQALSTSSTVTRQPYLQSMTQSSVIIVWLTQQNAPSIVEIGETPALGTVIRTSGSRSKHAVTVTGLKAGTRYYYRINSTNGPITPRYSFRSAPAGNVADFSFLAFGDSGDGSSRQYDLAARMNREKFDFILHTGDVIYPAGENRLYQPNFFTPYAPMLSRAPVWLAIGNHDLNTLGIAYQDVFFLPKNNPAKTELYYSFEYGDAKFISLDTTIFGHIPLGKHMTWLQGELASNTKRWLIVFCHIPVFSSGSHGNDKILEYNLLPLFENYRVDIMLTGHDHNYERFKPIKKFNQSPSFKGITHLVTGGGGKGTRGMNAPQSTSAFAEASNHFMRFDVSRNQIRGRAIRIDGAVIDDFVVTK